MWNGREKRVESKKEQNCGEWRLIFEFIFWQHTFYTWIPEPQPITNANVVDDDDDKELFT